MVNSFETKIFISYLSECNKVLLGLWWGGNHGSGVVSLRLRFKEGSSGAVGAVMWWRWWGVSADDEDYVFFVG